MAAGYVESRIAIFITTAASNLVSDLEATRNRSSVAVSSLDD